MDTKRALDADIELDGQDAEGVKAGGVSASVDGVGGASTGGSGIHAGAGSTGVSATGSEEAGWTAGARSRGAEAGAKGGAPVRLKRTGKKVDRTASRVRVRKTP